MVPHAFALDGSRFTIRRASLADVPAIVRLIEDDPVAALRDGAAPWSATTAFERVDACPEQLLVVVEEEGGAVVGTLQLTFIAGLSRRGATRVQIDAVRVRADRRGRGVGSALLDWAVAHSRASGVALAQLTSDAARSAAHAFYEDAGFSPTHVGFTRSLG